MSVSVRQQGSVTIVSLQGQITGDTAMLKAVRAALDTGARSILMDMTGITAVDSSGIGELNNVRAAVTDRGGAIKLLVPSAVTNVPGIAQLSGFQTFRTEKDAIVSFGSV
jgi:anti-sigma B factor antagonist